MKNILVTGGAGFIASNLIKSLCKLKSIKKIYSLDNYSSGTKDNHLIDKKIIYLKDSTSNINKISKLKNKNFDTVFHFAEFSRIVPSFKYFDECWESNVIGTKEVLTFCVKNKSKLIYSASSSTFGKNKHLSPYSWTKYTNNELIKNFSKWYGLKYVTVYFFNVYGNNQITNGKMAAVIGIFMDQYIKGKPISVVKPGTQKRDFTHVDDIIRGTLLAAKKNNSEFQIGSGKNYSVLEIAKSFNHPIKMVSERPGERFISLSNLQESSKILGYKPKHDLIKFIKNFVKEI